MMMRIRHAAFAAAVALAPATPLAQTPRRPEPESVVYRTYAVQGCGNLLQPLTPGGPTQNAYCLSGVATVGVTALPAPLAYYQITFDLAGTRAPWFDAPFGDANFSGIEYGFTFLRVGATVPEGGGGYLGTSFDGQGPWAAFGVLAQSVVPNSVVLAPAATANLAYRDPFAPGGFPRNITVGLTLTPIPEPGTLALVGLAVVGVGVVGRRRHRRCL